MGVTLSGVPPADPSRPKGILEMIQEAIAAPGGVGAVLASIVMGIVGGLVGAVQGIAGLIGGLFNLGRQDTAAVDQARVEGERAIVANMSTSLEYLDEIQRVGGAYSDTPEWNISFGEANPHPIPLNAEWPLAQGTRWLPATKPWLWSSGHTLAGSDSNRGLIAERTGTLELQESGLWMIYFQAALLQGSQYTNTPADVWCYVKSDSVWIPVGAPTSSTIEAYNRLTGARRTDYSTSLIEAYGRAGQYLGIRDTNQGGGNTVSGFMMAYLDSPGWFVNLACSGYKHFGGPMSTFVFAQKVNSETLRQSIDNLKTQIAAALPGENVEKALDENAIAAMVAQAEQIDVLSGEADDA